MEGDSQRSVEQALHLHADLIMHVLAEILCRRVDPSQLLDIVQVLESHGGQCLVECYLRGGEIHDDPVLVDIRNDEGDVDVKSADVHDLRRPEDLAIQGVGALEVVDNIETEHLEWARGYGDNVISSLTGVV